MATTTLATPGPMIATIAMPSRITGKANRMSTIRPTSASYQPAEVAGRQPDGAADQRGDQHRQSVLASSVIRPPYRTRLSRSRPNSSVPNGWAADGGRSRCAMFWMSGEAGASSGAADGDQAEHQRRRRARPSAASAGAAVCTGSRALAAGRCQRGGAHRRRRVVVVDAVGRRRSVTSPRTRQPHARIEHRDRAGPPPG